MPTVATSRTWVFLSMTLLVLATLAATADPSLAALPTGSASITPLGPYSTGQLVTVTVGPNAILEPGRSLSIEECAAPTRGPISWRPRCDPRTRQRPRVSANLDGSFSYSGYPLVALTNGWGPASARHRAVCDLTHTCRLIIGWDLDDPGHRVWSAPFLVGPPGGDPGTSTPEVPDAMVLPLVAVAIFGGWVAIRRRMASGL